MRVLKFGGTSVGSPQTIRGLIGILKTYHQRGERFAVVFSAFSKVTDTLIEMATRAAKGDATYHELLLKVRARHFDAIEELLSPPLRPPVEAHIESNFEALENILQGIYLVHEVSPRTLDYVMSFGERNAAFIIALAMRASGIPTEFLDARILVRTDAQFGNAKVDFEETNRRIRAHFDAHPQVQAITGFVGSTSDDITTTLGHVDLGCLQQPLPIFHGLGIDGTLFLSLDRF